jgi:hypothetical protein
MRRTIMAWVPVPPDKCGECGRYTPQWYNERNADIADAYGEGVTSRRLAKAYGISEQRAVEIITDELGRRAYLTAWHEEDE